MATVLRRSEAVRAASPKSPGMLKNYNTLKLKEPHLPMQACGNNKEAGTGFSKILSEKEWTKNN